MRPALPCPIPSGQRRIWGRFGACTQVFAHIGPKRGTKKGSQNPLEPLHWNGSGRQDSNLRPSAPKAPALPSCATPRREGAYPPPMPVAGLHYTVQR